VNKRVAVIGTGASGVQTIQETGRDAKQLTAYQRTPNFAIPMNQKKIDAAEHAKMKKDGGFEKAFQNCHTTFAGFNYDFSEKNTFDDTPEEREKFYHHLLVEEGGFRFWLNTYADMLKDEKANMEVSVPVLQHLVHCSNTPSLGLQLLAQICNSVDSLLRRNTD